MAASTFASTVSVARPTRTVAVARSAADFVTPTAFARAHVLDGELRRLAHAEVRHRQTFGLLAHELLRRKAYHELGFARVGDYSRERLDCSARELQSMASVATALQALPQLSSALSNAEISWTHARLLVTAATAATEQAWLAAARGRSVREVEKLVAGSDAVASRSAADSGSDAGSSAAGSGSATGTGSAACGRNAVGESTPGFQHDDVNARFHLPVPRSLRVRWRYAIELARRMSGEPLAVWQAAEAITAECSSGPLVGRVDADCVVTHDVLGDRDADKRCDSKPISNAFDPLLNGDCSGAPLDGDDRASKTEELQQAAADVLDARLRSEVHAIHTLDAKIGNLLRRLVDDGAHRALCFSSVADYVETRLAISSRRARALLALERGARRSPSVYKAYVDGRLSWLRALTILPVARGAHAGAWVARAREVTVRRLVDEVQWACDACDTSDLPIASIAPPAKGSPLRTPERQMRAYSGDEPVDGRITFYGPAAVVATLHNAIAALALRNQPRWHGLMALLDHAIGEWEAQPRHRDPIFQRDGWRCTVPACSSRRNLQDHHIVFRSRGGSNARDNRVSLCAWHHLRGIHGGVVKASGRAPHAIRWELGRRHEGGPLLTLVGDYYVTAN